MVKKLVNGIVGVLGIVLFFSKPMVVQAQMPFTIPLEGGRMRVEGPPGFMFPLMTLKKLDLTPTQESRIEEIMAAQQGSLKSLFKQLEAAHEQVTAKFLAPGSLSTADFAQHTQNISQLREQLMQEGLKAALAIREVLTPEQLAKAAQMQQKMRAMRTEMRQLFEDND